MESILIYGGIPLQGQVRIQGSKNAALPILAATILVGGGVFLENCPKITDVFRMTEILKQLGCLVLWEKDGLHICTDSMKSTPLVGEDVRKMRSSICMLGALLSRTGEAVVDYPGGCVIGSRPIDLHIENLQKMGAMFQEEEHFLRGRAKTLKGASLRLPIASVGATENCILAACKAEGVTRIVGAAREPEVSALCEFLNHCGAKIEGIGESILCIEGQKKLMGCRFRIPADRIVAGTYLFATVGTGGSVFLKDAPVEQMEKVIQTAEKMGALCQPLSDGLFVERTGHLANPYKIETGEYPGFPTDLQSVILPLLCKGMGNTGVIENIFEDRFRILPSLKKMGAEIQQLDAHRVLVKGGKNLHGKNIEAQELRGGAGLVLAGLMADGETVLSGVEYIDRGYVNICRDFRELGARVIRV